MTGPLPSPSGIGTCTYRDKRALRLEFDATEDGAVSSNIYG